MDRDLVALLGFVLMLVLMVLRVPIGIAMGIVGVLGFGMLSTWTAAFNLLANVPLSVVTDYDLAVIPMFILMGAFASQAGMSKELFTAGRAWFGHRRGGLALASIASCAGFAAINGSSVATAATMSQVALPEMRRAGYDPGFSAGLIAAGGTLGIMIPPSVIFVLYGIMTDTDITQLFAAGVVPVCWRWLDIRSSSTSRHCGTPPCCLWANSTPGGNASAASKTCGPSSCCSCSCWAASMGGLFTVQEAAGAGAIGTLLIGVVRGQLRSKTIQPRAHRCIAGLLRHPADRGGRLPVWLLPHYHAVHPEGGRFSCAPARWALRCAGARDAGLPVAGRGDGRAGHDSPDGSRRLPCHGSAGVTDRKFNRMRPSMARVFGFETRRPRQTKAD
jgi:C4-dicarboxylate transporter DctM subunit